MRAIKTQDPQISPGLLAGLTPLGADFKAIAQRLMAAALSALGDAGLALIGIGSLAKALLLASTLLVLVALIHGRSLMGRIFHAKHSGL